MIRNIEEIRKWIDSRNSHKRYKDVIEIWIDELMFRIEMEEK